MVKKKDPEISFVYAKKDIGALNCKKADIAKHYSKDFGISSIFG